MIENKKIVRETGIPIILGNCFYCFAGGGYKGSTKELDDIVKKEAKILYKLYKKDIVIRFNSDRNSGGAWIKDNQPEPKKDTMVGLGSFLYSDIPKNWNKTLEEKGIKRYSNEETQLRYGLPKKIVYQTSVDVSVLKEGRKDKYNENGKRYFMFDNELHMNHKKLISAINWIRNNVDPKRIK